METNELIPVSMFIGPLMKLKATIEKAKGKPVNNLVSMSEQDRVDEYNSQRGDLEGYQCAACRNRGNYAVLVDGVMSIQQCKCIEIRRCIRLMKESGISSAYTLQNFKVSSEWQRSLLAMANRFLLSPGCWFYAGGQVGSGKTHICTGIVRELLQQGYPARYMLWRDASVKIKAVVGRPEEYAALVEPLKTVEVLYIDDFLKSNTEPTPADFNLAFEILNARYNRRLVTIISSEYFLGEITEMDEAVGSRIYERTAGCLINIARDSRRNYRLQNITRL